METDNKVIPILTEVRITNENHDQCGKVGEIINYDLSNGPAWDSYCVKIVDETGQRLYWLSKNMFEVVK